MKDQKQEVTSLEKQMGKKPYRKPRLQVYGTLTQMTAAGPNAGVQADNPQPADNNHRT